MSQGVVPGWVLAVCLVLLVLIAVVGSRIGRMSVERDLVVAAGRAVVQLALVSTVVALVISEPWASVLFCLVMFAAATFTAGGRIEARGDWPWIALALASGVLPVLIVIFSLGVAPFVGAAIIPIAGIIIGGSMTAHTLTTRRAFDALRSDNGQVDAGLALGMPRQEAITNVIERHAPEALTPILDQTRTVGLVTLPGAFIGVLLGGGSAAEAAAAQILVLVGLLAAETLVVVWSQRLIAAGRILAPGLRAKLPPK